MKLINLKKICFILFGLSLFAVMSCSKSKNIDVWLDKMEAAIDEFNEATIAYSSGELSDEKYFAKCARISADMEKYSGLLEFVDESDLTEEQLERMFLLMAQMGDIDF